MENAKECSRLIIENRETIIEQWEEEVIQNTVAEESGSPALRNHIPELLDDIADILSEKQDEEFHHKDEYLQTAEKNKAHGKLRAEFEDYTIDQVIHEYFILHRVITELLQKEEVLSINISNLIKYIFDSTIMRASSAFTTSNQERQDKLVGTLAHDIRNPLTSALSAIELIEESPNGNEKLVRLAKRGLYRSINLTEELLDSISIRSGEGMMMNFTEADYVKLVKETCDEASKIYTENVLCEVAGESVKATMDVTSVRRLLDNLISNAVKHGGGPSSPIRVKFQEMEKEVVLMVNNQGNPIPLEKQETIFGFLNQENNELKSRKHKGWGMGLTLVKLVVDAHDGSIDLTSNEAEGTTFKVTLSKCLKHSGKVRLKVK